MYKGKEYELLEGMDGGVMWFGVGARGAMVAKRCEAKRLELCTKDYETKMVLTCKEKRLE